MLAPRISFESWISAPPFEKDIARFPETSSAWPGNYIDITVDLAWQAWKESYNTYSNGENK